MRIKTFCGILSAIYLSAVPAAAQTGNNTIDPNETGATDVVRDSSGSAVLLSNPLPDNLDLGSDSLIVGNTGDGELLIADGGTVTSDSVSIAADGGSTGVVTVDGASSTLTVNDPLQIGSQGSGDLTISSGGTVSVTGRTWLSALGGSTGNAVVTGVDSTLTTSEIIVGWRDSGNLTVSEGGNVSVTTLSSIRNLVGNATGGVGEVTVTGTDSQLSIESGLHVGFQGNGTLTITEGGSVALANNGEDTRVASELGSTGTVTVDGAGSTFTNALALRVGNLGTGTLDITNGGSVTSGAFSTLGSGSSTVLGGTNGNGVGIATVDGVGSSWAINGQFRVGSSGDGNLIVRNGGTVSAVDSFIANSPGSVGTATITGVGSMWTNTGGLTSTGGLFVGAQGQGTLRIENGGVVQSVLGRVGQSSAGVGEVTISDSRSQWATSGSLVVGNDGTGTLIVESGGGASSSAGFVGSDGGSLGTATITGAGSAWQNSGLLNIGQEGNGTLDILASGIVSNTDGSIGIAAGSTGTVTVDGAGSQWNNSRDLIVGNQGNGSLFVDNGGVITSDNAIIGRLAGAVGLVLVGDAGSQFAVARGLDIGTGLPGSGEAPSGSGTLEVTNAGELFVGDAITVFRSGRLSLNDGSIRTRSFDNSLGGDWDHFGGQLIIDGGEFAPGTSEQSSARYVIDGPNGPLVTLLNASASNLPDGVDLWVGDELSGSLEVSDGSVFSGDRDVVAARSGSDGEVNVDGVGTTWRSRLATIGFGGFGRANITGGANFLVSEDLRLAEDPESFAELNLAGAGSRAIVKGRLLIGEEGTAEFVVSNGARAGSGQGDLGNLSNSLGSVSITGPGSSWDVENELWVGSLGVGHLDVLDHGRLNAGQDVFIGLRQGGSGRVVVEGTGSALIIQRDLYIGGNTESTQGLGLLIIAEDGLVNVFGDRGVVVWDNSELRISGGSLNVALGSISLGNGSLLSGHGQIKGKFDSGNRGLITVNGGVLSVDESLTTVSTTLVQSTGTLQYSGGGVFNPSRETILAGGALTADAEITLNSEHELRGHGSVTGRLTAMLGSTIHALGSAMTDPANLLTVGDVTSAKGFYSNGDIVVEEGAILRLSDANGAVVDSDAAVRLGVTGQGAGPSTLSAASGLTLNVGGSVQGVGTINTPDDAATPFINNGHITGNSSTEVVTLTGYVKGVGTLDNVLITGTDAPGFSPATVNRGSVEYAGTLEIEIGGTGVGRFDQLNHILGEGDALLGGELVVSLIDGYTPEAGDTFEFLTATGEITGDFDIETLPAIGGGLFFDVLYNPGTVELVVAGIEGDYNIDAIVSAADYAIFRDTLGQQGSALAADGSFNEEVDASDFDVWAAAFGSTSNPISASSASTTVPEPSSLLLALATCTLMAAQAKRKRI